MYVPGGGGSLKHKPAIMIGLAVYLMFMSLLFFGDFYIGLDYHILGTSAVDEITPGERVKLYGTITSSENNSTTVIWYETHTAGRETTTTFDSVRYFTLEDGTGNATVYIEPGEVYFAGKSRYRIGDRICVVGTVSSLSADIVNARAVGRSPDSFLISKIGSGVSWLLFMICGLFFLYLGIDPFQQERKSKCDTYRVSPGPYSPDKSQKKYPEPGRCSTTSTPFQPNGQRQEYRPLTEVYHPSPKAEYPQPGTYRAPADSQHRRQN